MKVELIPVIEIFNADEGIDLPDSGPFWKYSEDWENYNRLSNISAGFSDKLKSYLKGSSFYKIDEVPDTDLLKIIQEEIVIQQSDEQKGVEDVVCAFSGGYILRVDNKDIYFPQCCGDLADIEEWKNLINGKTEFFYPGHPFPRVTESDNKICFDFVNIEISEKFTPPVPVEMIEIDKSELEAAIINTEKELQVFADRLSSINQAENLNIPNIDKRLIWGETE